MPIATTYPGVYIEEIPSGVRTITGAATSIAAFVDYFRRGRMNEAFQVLSFADFEREFGGLDAKSEASYALRQFFLNGGTQAWVVRVASNNPAKATVVLRDGVGTGASSSLTISAKDEGKWGEALRVTVEHDPSSSALFNLSVSEVGTAADGRQAIARQESFRGLSLDSGNARYVVAVLAAESILVRAEQPGTTRPAASGTISSELASLSLPSTATSRAVKVTFTPGGPFDVEVLLGTDAINSVEEAAARLQAAIRSAKPLLPAWAQATVRAVGNRLQVAAGPSSPEAIITFGDGSSDTTTRTALGLVSPSANVSQYQVGSIASSAGQGAGTAGNDGGVPDEGALVGSQAVDPPTGMHALDKVPIFNLLCLPRVADLADAQADSVIAQATTYCESRWAFLILDTPTGIKTPAAVRNWMRGKGTMRHKNLAFYFPRVQVTDPLKEGRLRSIGASGTMAGLYARTDAARGVWKAPAGTEAVLRGVAQLEYRMTDQENGTLNPEAINALRFFEAYGNICWGARTLDGSDQRASEWKYIPIRRLALFLEKSVYDALHWVVFEPNDEPLWSQIRLNVGAFMHGLFRQGAFQGQTAREAYLVKCDGETTNETDRNLGVVNIIIGFAPLKPAEFVIIKIQQIAGRIET